MGSSFEKEAFYFADTLMDSIFSADGVRTRSVLIKNEGIVTLGLSLYPS